MIILPISIIYDAEGKTAALSYPTDVGTETFAFTASTGLFVLSERSQKLVWTPDHYSQAVAEAQVFQRECLLRFGPPPTAIPQHDIRHRRAGNNLIMDGVVEGQEFASRYHHHPNPAQRVVKLAPRGQLTLTLSGFELFLRAHATVVGFMANWT